MIKIAIVEDDEEAAKAIQKYILQFGRENGEAFDIAVYTDALMFLDGYSRETDIVFMDIELPYINGIEASRRLRKIDGEVMIIFVTNLSQYAINGYEVNAFDFVVKPIRYKSFSIRLQKMIPVAKRRRDNDCIAIKGYEKRVLPISDIFFVETQNHKVIYHTTAGDIESWDSMKNCREKLEKYGFSLCNSCYLVNLKFVRKVEGDAAFVGGDTLKISRGRKREFIDALTSCRG